MQSDTVWGVESFMLDIYLLLVHRIEGIGLTLNDFWEMDTWVTSKFYLTELDLIEREERASNGKSSVNPEDYNSPEAEAVFEEMFGSDEE